MPKLHKIVFTLKFHPLHAKISTPTGTAVPVEKEKEMSSSVRVSMRNISEETENECYLPFLKMQLQNTLVSRWQSCPQFIKCYPHSCSEFFLDKSHFKTKLFLNLTELWKFVWTIYLKCEVKVNKWLPLVTQKSTHKMRVFPTNFPKVAR